MEGWRRLLPLLGVGGVVAAAVYAAGLGSPVTTTTTTVDASLVDYQISGPALEWRQLGVVGSGSPMAFGKSNGSYFLFATAGDRFVGWRSSDLTVWEELAMSGAPDTAGSVLIDDLGLVATGSDSGGRPVVWTSTDGSTWTEEELTGPEGGDASISGALRHQGRLIVYGTVYDDPWQEATAAATATLPSELQTAVEAGDLWVNFSPDGTSMSLHGPLDLPVYQADFADPVPTCCYSETSTLWISDGGGAWEAVAFLEGVSLSSIGIAPDDGLVAFGYRGMARLQLVSPDGRAWEQAEPNHVTDPVAEWGDRLVAPSLSGNRFYTSPDGSNWDTLEIPNGLFPNGSRLSWQISRMAAGPLGLVATAFDVQWDQANDQEPQSVMVIEDDAGRVELSWDTGTITVFDGAGVEVLTLRNFQPHPAVSYDPTAQAVVLTDPEDGSVLMTVTVDQWQQALEDMEPGPGPTVSDALFVFTTDGETWSATEPEWLRSRSADDTILVEEGRALAAAITLVGGEPVISIWEGILPSADPGA